MQNFNRKIVPLNSNLIDKNNNTFDRCHIQKIYKLTSKGHYYDIIFGIKNIINQIDDTACSELINDIINSKIKVHRGIHLSLSTLSQCIKKFDSNINNYATINEQNKTKKYQEIISALLDITLTASRDEIYI